MSGLNTEHVSNNDVVLRADGSVEARGSACLHVEDPQQYGYQCDEGTVVASRRVKHRDTQTMRPLTTEGERFGFAVDRIYENRKSDAFRSVVVNNDNYVLAFAKDGIRAYRCGSNVIIQFDDPRIHNANVSFMDEHDELDCDCHCVLCRLERGCTWLAHSVMRLVGCKK